MKDITGQTFGLLTALRPTKKRVGYSVVWRMRCACGVEKDIAQRQFGPVASKTWSLSCGCVNRGLGSAWAIDLTGARYGKLTVSHALDRKGQGLRWICRCDCGNSTIARAKDLRAGTTTSCGCGRNAGAAEARRGRTGENWRAGTIAEGEKFGLLTVQGVASIEAKLGRHYLCRCDCGGQTIVRSGLLRTGQTKSCGCLRRLGGAKRLENRLREIEAAGNTAAELRASPEIRFRLNAELARGGLMSCESVS